MRYRNATARSARSANPFTGTSSGAGLPGMLARCPALRYPDAMNRALRAFGVLLLAVTSTGGGCAAAPRTSPAFTPASGLRLEAVARGLDQPLYVTAPRSDPRLFIVEQPGRIRILANGRLFPTPFLDLRNRIRSGGEQGLLSMAF